MEALTSRRSQGTRVGHTNSFRRRITRLAGPARQDRPQDHLTSATEHERALTTRELASGQSRWVGADRHLPELPTTEAPRAGSSSGEPALRCCGAHEASWSPPRVTSRTRLRHRCSDEPCGRSLIAPHGVRLGVTMRVHMVRNVRTEMAARFSERAASLELIQQQQVIVAGQRGVIMRGRRRSRYGPPTRRRTRTNSMGRRARPRPDVDGQVDEAMFALVRLLARQAAREAFDQAVAKSDPSVERAANESRHLRPVLVREPARRVDH
jgi:hypothetical protein